MSWTNFRPGQTNIKGADGLPLRRAVLGQLSAEAMVNIVPPLRNKSKFMKEKQTMA